MADETYMNPFQANPVGDGPYNGFATGVESARRNFELAPFKQMEQQRQELGLQKQQQQQTEFMSPEAIQSRTSAFGATSAENKLKQTEAEGKEELHPLQQEALVTQARQHLAETKGKPSGLLLEQLGNAAPYISSAPQGMKSSLYKSIVEGVKSRYLGMEFPQEWQEYSPGVENHLKALHYAQVHDVGQAKEMEKVTAQGQAHVAGSEATARGQIGRGEAQAAGTVAAAEIRGPGGQFRELEGYRKILNDPKKSPEEKASASGSLEMAVEPIIDDKLTKAWGNEANAQMLFGDDPVKMKSRQQGMDKMRKDMRLHYGVDVRMKDTKGQVRIVPRGDMDEAIKSGYKQVK